MANKIPVVSTNVGAIPNVITPAHGWLYNRRKAQELAEILKIIVRDVDKIRIYGIKSREFVSEHYSIVKVEKEYNIIYVGKPNE
jgi:glycosyltransferase involved in cell wall biosynthesis